MKSKKGSGGIEGLFARHVEKGAMGVVLILVAVLFWGGWTHKLIDSQKGSPSLERVANNALAQIGQPRWQAFEATRFPVEDLYLERVDDALVRVPVGDYPTVIPFTGFAEKTQSKRTDPQLFPVENLEVYAGFGAFAESSARQRGPKFRPPSTELSDFQKSHVPGYRPDGNATAKGHYFVAIKGLVPVKRQNEEFDGCFLRAKGYDEKRDTPNYIYYSVERAEILPDGTPSQWTVVGSSQTMRKTEARWAGLPDEIVDADFVDQDLLTAPIPPLLLQDLTQLAMHSAVSRRKVEAAEDVQDEDADPSDGIEPWDSGDGLDDFGDRDAPLDDSGGLGPDAVAGSDVDETIEKKRVDYKLLRYYDFSAKPGAVYQYRIRLYLEDPNAPKDSSQRPPPATLASEVIDRIKNTPPRDRKYYRYSDWSEESPAVRVPEGGEVLCGEVLQETYYSFLGLQRVIQREPPKAKILTVVWDLSQAANVPGLLDVVHGSVLNFTSSVTVLDPVSLSRQEIDSYPFETETVVMDIRGGVVPGRARVNTAMPIPGEVLLLSRDGKLLVRNELDDRPGYNRHLFAEEAFSVDHDDGGEPEVEGGGFHEIFDQ